MEPKRLGMVFLSMGVIAIVVSTLLYQTAEGGSVVFQTGSGNVSMAVEVARTPEEQARGLMYRDSLPQDNGMLFVFGQSQKLTFWMKNTLIPLDMVFVSEDFVIVKIERDVPPCRTEACPTYGSVTAKYVVEVNGGFCDARGIKEGDVVHIRA